MKKTAFTEEPVTYALRQAEAGTAVTEVCRKLGISEQTCYRWQHKYAGMGSANRGDCASSKTRTARTWYRR